MANTSAVFSPTAFNLKAFSNTAFNFGQQSRETEFIAVGGWLDNTERKPKIRGNDDEEIITILVSFLNSV